MEGRCIELYWFDLTCDIQSIIYSIMVVIDTAVNLIIHTLLNVSFADLLTGFLPFLWTCDELIYLNERNLKEHPPWN